LTYMLVTIVDSISGRNMTMVYSPDDRHDIIEHWNKEDAILRALQDDAPFTGRLRWSDLNTVHFKFLLTRGVEQVFENLDDPKTQEATMDMDNVHPVMNSLNFLVMAYAHSIEQNANCRVENLRIIRHGKHEMTINLVSFVDASFAALYDGVEKPKPPTFKLLSRDDE
jgi:hypothetical protein